MFRASTVFDCYVEEVEGTSLSFLGCSQLQRYEGSGLQQLCQMLSEMLTS